MLLVVLLPRKSCEFNISGSVICDNGTPPVREPEAAAAADSATGSETVTYEACWSGSLVEGSLVMVVVDGGFFAAVAEARVLVEWMVFVEVLLSAAANMGCSKLSSEVVKCAATLPRDLWVSMSEETVTMSQHIIHCW